MNSSDTVGNRHGSAIITLPSDTEILITGACQEHRDSQLASGMESG
jgi:hypothetical protein